MALAGRSDEKEPHMKRTPQIVGFMTPFPYSIDIDAPLSEARAFMQHHRIRHLPVTAHRAIVGIVTDRDIKLMLGPDFAYPPERELKVRDACAEDPYVVPASTPLALVAETMAKRHIGSAVITKKDALVGIFTSTDACRVLAQLLRPHEPLGSSGKRKKKERRVA
jgi:CBS domain-containing protein